MKKIIISSLMFCGLVMAGTAAAQQWTEPKSRLEQRAGESQSAYEQRLRSIGYTNEEIIDMRQAENIPVMHETMKQSSTETRAEYERRLRSEGYTDQQIRQMERHDNIPVTTTRWEGKSSSETKAQYERRLRSEGYTNEQIRQMERNGNAYITPAERREASKELNETRIEQQRKIDQAETKAANDLNRARSEGWSQSEINRVQREGEAHVRAVREEANRELNKSTNNWRNTNRY